MTPQLRGGTATVARGCHRTAPLPSAAAEVVAEAGSESFCFKEGRVRVRRPSHMSTVSGSLFVCIVHTQKIIY